MTTSAHDSSLITTSSASDASSASESAALEPAVAASPRIAVKPTSEPVAPAERSALLADPGFGRIFTDHMVTVAWTAGRGWYDAQLRPYASLELEPSAMVFHYGQAIFEGLKVYRQPDGTVAAFRPSANAERFRASARRLAMPELPSELFVEAVDTLVRQDGDWVPSGGDKSLYVRPFMIATEASVGLRPAQEFLFLVIASPAGPYFSRGVQPVSVWLSEDYVRAAPGGTGAAKAAGNYAASLLAQAQAAEQGCDQVVWLDAIERRWIEEMGSNNLYFVYGSRSDARLVTPELSGSLLPGIIRESILTLAADLGYAVEESRISVDDWRSGAAAGTLTEVFGCGTAAVITPVGSVKAAGGAWTVGDGGPGEVTMRLRKALLDIQTGVAPDRHGWMHRID